MTFDETLPLMDDILLAYPHLTSDKARVDSIRKAMCTFAEEHTRQAWTEYRQQGELLFNSPRFEAIAYRIQKQAETRSAQQRQEAKRLEERRQEAEIEAGWKQIDATIGSMSDEALEKLKAVVIERSDERAKAFLAKSDPRTSRMLKSLIMEEMK